MTSSVDDKAGKLSSTLLKVFDGWKDTCIKSKNPSSKEDLRSEAKSLFSSLFHTTEVVADRGLVLKTKAAHGEALAQLIKRLGPALESGASLVSRICAIYCLCGAVEGCREDGLSLSAVKLLGTFLLGHCGPIEDDDGEDFDEAVRDAAVISLSSLVCCKITTTPQDEASEGSVARTRADLARQGVQRRCMSEDLDEVEYEQGYEARDAHNDVRDGLSSLPRSRRSLCFALVRSCVDAIAMDSSVSLPISVSAEEVAYLASFAEFAASCLHGESDPRCLMQLLLMLHQLQQALLPFFQGPQTFSARFPILSLFDAVAPYYPIQFTPPPNDTHGITRSGLSAALMAVLRFTDFDSLTDSRETMLNLATGLVLERLLPLESDDGSSPSTLEDKLEALGDLSSLLYQGEHTKCDALHADTVRDLSNALIAAHAEGASGIAADEEDKRKYKRLTDSCRSLVSRLALSFESSARGSALWDIFVKDAVESLSPLLSTSPQSAQGRSAVAYIACLASCGGTRTLGLCLDSCLFPLVDILTENTKDEERITAAVYGIGAFFSSYSVAADRSGQIEVIPHPHPLDRFGTRSVCAISDILLREDSDDRDFLQVRIASFRAVDAILNATPSIILEETALNKICDVILLLFNLTTESPGHFGGTTWDENYIEMRKAASRALGVFVAKSFEDGRSASDGVSGQQSVPSVVDENETIRSLLRGRIFEGLVESSQQSRSDPFGRLRTDWMALACASEYSERATEPIVSALASRLRDSLKKQIDGSLSVHPAKASAMAFSTVIRSGGKHAAVVFHNLSEPDATPMDIVTILLATSTSTERTLRRGISNLALPCTDEERSKIRQSVEMAYQILPLLLPAYDLRLSAIQIKPLLDHVAHVLPPLSDWQAGQLCIALPLLSCSLCHGMEAVDSMHLQETLISIAPSLTDYALTGNDAQARSAAASCLYTVVAKLVAEKNRLDLVALRESILPAIVSSLDGISKTRDPGLVAAFSDSVNLAALMGSASACHGGSLSATADEIGKFLCLLACQGKARLPLLDEEITIDLPQVTTGEVDICTQLCVAAASAFGSMIEVEDGSPFWRQRLAHLAMTQILEFSNDKRFSNDGTFSRWGKLMLTCYALASRKIPSISQEALTGLTSIVVQGFLHCFGESTSVNDKKSPTVSLMSVVETVTATVVKLMVVSPKTVLKYTSSLVPCFLRAFVADDSVNYLPVKLLALQGLQIASHSPEEFKQTLLGIKPTVLAVLSRASDHQSPVLRRVAVDVANAWSVLLV